MRCIHDNYLMPKCQFHVGNSDSITEIVEPPIKETNRRAYFRFAEEGTASFLPDPDVTQLADPPCASAVSSVYLSRATSPTVRYNSSSFPVRRAAGSSRASPAFLELQ